MGTAVLLCGTSSVSALGIAAARHLVIHGVKTQVFLPDAAKYPSQVETELRLPSDWRQGGDPSGPVAGHRRGPDRDLAGGPGDVDTGAVPTMAQGRHRLGSGMSSSRPRRGSSATASISGYQDDAHLGTSSLSLSSVR